jgi:hypothetical protein
MITNILMKVGLMSMATGAALVIIVGTITAMHSEQAFAEHTGDFGIDVDIDVKMPRAHAHTPVPEEHHDDEFPPPHTR